MVGSVIQTWRPGSGRDAMPPSVRLGHCNCCAMSYWVARVVPARVAKRLEAFPKVNISSDWSPLRMPLSADAAPVEPTGATRCGLDTLLAIDVILLNRQDVEDAKE